MTYRQARAWLREVGGTCTVRPLSFELDRVTVQVPGPIHGCHERTALVRARLRGRAHDEAVRAAVTRACEELLVVSVRPVPTDVALPRSAITWQLQAAFLLEGERARRSGESTQAE